MSDLGEENDMIADEAELFGASEPIAPLSPLRPELNNGPTENDGVLAALQIPGETEGNDKVEKKTEKKKRPRVTLNEEKLIGKNGIRELPKMLKGVKFQGKGYEKDDLNLLLRKIEHWAHLMVPQSQFIDVVDKLEQLGSRKIVKEHAHIVKTGLPIRDEVEEDEMVHETENDENLRAENQENERDESMLGMQKRLESDDIQDDIQAMLDEDFGHIDFE